MSRRIALRTVLVAAIVLPFTLTSTATPVAPGTQLVLIAVPEPEDQQRVAGAGLPVYTRLHSSDGLRILAGATAKEVAALAAAGLDYRILDADTAGPSYYLVYPPPGDRLTGSSVDGVVLYSDPHVMIVRSEQAAMERLAETGVELARVTLDPKPLRSNSVAAFPLVSTPDPVVRWMVEQVKQDTVYGYEEYLTGVKSVTVDGGPYWIKTRYTKSGAPIQKATHYVRDHLVALGLTVEEHTWGYATAPNVIGQKTGSTRPDDIFMITAHLDDLPTGATAPGADDNASGSTAVLVAADILSQFAWDCTLRFALWTGEEQGLLGSAEYARRARANGENILGVFNLDMIGWNDPDSSPDIDLHASASIPATIDLANQAASVIDAYDLPLIPEVRSDGLGASDHASFWDWSYTAILGVEDFYPSNHDFSIYFHKTTDTLSTLDLGYLTAYVKAVVAETAHMAGCLTTGRLQGQVLASHDGSPIANAEIKLQDAAAREYQLYTGDDGSYSQALPPGTYTAAVSAYGYETSTVNGISLLANGSVTPGSTLIASAPGRPAVSITRDAAKAKLAWPHLSPNMAYQVHRSDVPYFEPEPSTRIETLDAAHPPSASETLAYRDGESGAGDATLNHFYVVLGMNAAGAGAASARTGEFDFTLTRPGGP